MIISAVPQPDWEIPLDILRVDPSRLEPAKVTFHPDTMLMVHGSFSPFHLSHMLLSSVIPLAHTLYTLDSVPSAPSPPLPKRHLFTVGKLRIPSEMRFFFPVEYLGFEHLYTSAFWPEHPPYSVVSPLPVLDGVTLQEGSLAGLTHCYPYATVGLNLTCTHCAVHHPSPEAFHRLRQVVWGHYGIAPGPLRLKPNTSDEAPDSQRHVAGGEEIPQVLIVRRKNSRGVLNPIEVLEVLAGFRAQVRTVELELMDFAAQVRAFAESDLVLAPHGNGNVHLSWMRPGAVVLEALTKRKYGKNFYRAVARDAGVRFEYLWCVDPRCEDPEDADPRLAFMYINPELLTEHLERYLERV